MTATGFNSNANESPMIAITSDSSGDSGGCAVETVHYEVVHWTVGRYRLRIPRLAQDEAYVRQLQQALSQLDFVTDVRVNVKSRSVVIQYIDRPASSEAIERRLFSAIQMNGLMPIVQSPEPSSDTEPISQLLQRFLEQHPGNEIRLRDLLNELGDRAFGPTLLICALPEALPLPIAGISTLVAMPLMLVSAQLALGFQQPWLPAPLLNQPFKREHCEQVISAAIPFLEKLEHFVEPRWPLFTSSVAERGVGVMLLFLSFIIALPIPFGNMLPAIVIVLICLGLIEKDGLIIVVSGIIMGITPALLLLVL